MKIPQILTLIHIRFIHTVGQKFDFIGFQRGLERIAFAHNLGWISICTFLFLFWQGLLLDGNRICMVIAFLFLQIAQILGKHDKINDNGQIGKPPIITGRFMQICIHIKIRAAETDILFSFIRIQVLKITAFPQKSGISISNTMLRTTRYFCWIATIFSVTRKISCRK